MPGLPSHIVALDSLHLEDAVALHAFAFPGFFLTSMGPSFLREFYRGFIGKDLAYAAVNTEGRLIGVIVGSAQPKVFFRSLMRTRWWAFGLAGIPVLLRRPSVLGRLLKAIVYRGNAGGTPLIPGYALLSSIAVDPRQQGTGIGRALITHWADAARRLGCAGCYLDTDAEGNADVNRFYSKAGWHLQEAYRTARGRVMNRYTLNFTI